MSVRVLAPDGDEVLMPPQVRLTFGRGQETDMVIAAGPDLSRQAGEIVADVRGAMVMNLSRSHALYVDGDGYHVRLPRADDDGPPGGWLIAHGTAKVGSTAMFRQGLAVRIAAEHAEHAEHAKHAKQPEDPGARPPGSRSDNGTTQPLMLRPDTKLFLVALLLCRPWLLDQSHATALPTSRQIARQALEFASARYQVELFDRDKSFRARIVEQVNDHLKYLRERVLASGLIPGGTRLTPAATAEVLIASDVVTHADLSVIEQPRWRSRQEDLWWMTR
jgi:hypothetical protein